MAKKIVTISEEKLRSIVEDAVRNVVNTYSRTDIDSLTKEEVEKMSVEYSKIPHIRTYGNPLTLYMPKPINEGLIKTYPLKKTVQYIKDYFGLSDFQIRSDYVGNGISHIIVIIPIKGDNLEQMEKAMSLCGYYLGSPKREEIKDGKIMELQFEARIQNDETANIINKESVLYHVTPSYNVKKILSLGLSPRSKNSQFDYPDRVYLIRGSIPMAEVRNLAEQLYTNNSSKGNNGEYTLLTLDVARFNDSIRLFVDPNYPGGVYTTSNIPPDTIIETTPFHIS